MARSTKRASERARSRRASAASPVACVAIGASAHSPKSLADLFTAMPTDIGAAFTVGVRQEDRGGPPGDILPSIAAATSMPVKLAEDGEVLEPDHIYLANGGSLMTVEAGRIKVAETDQPSADRGVVDSLLVSVAESYERAAIVVVLAGLGSHGATGMAAARRCGGFSLAEASAGDLEPADQALAAGMADLRLPAERIPEEIAAYVRSLLATEKHVLRLEAELRVAKERLQTAIEELESTNHELQTSNGELAHRVSDITGARRAEAALRASERRFGEAQQLAGIGVWEWNLDTDETWWSPVTYQLWNVPIGEQPPPIDERPIHPEDRPAYRQAISRARETGALNIEWRVMLPDGSTRWLTSTGRMERFERGRRMLGVTQDITERKQTEMRLKLLLGELQHRVRNILGVVRSIVGRTVRSATSMDELASHLDGRLDTLARTQGVFTRSGDAAVGLEEMVRDEMLSVAAREEQITVEGPALRLRREAAETFALALHELTTNAVKYGALSRSDGKVSVRWRIVHAGAGPRLSLEWQESGVPAMNTAPARSGFGRELIERGLPYELGATTALEFGRGGVRAVIELPLTEKLAILDQGNVDIAE